MQDRAPRKHAAPLCIVQMKILKMQHLTNDCAMLYLSQWTLDNGPLLAICAM